MKKLVPLSSLLLTALAVTSASEGFGWADVKPGETLTKPNITQTEELLTPLTQWMVEQGMPMQIIENKKVHWPNAYQEATQKYSQQVKLAPDGRDIYDYVAGCPFPQIDINDPLAGFRVMWNYLQKPYDDTGTDYVLQVVNSEGVVERTVHSLWRQMMWTGRLSLDPKPVIPHSPSIHYTELWGPALLSEGDTGGPVTLNIHYLASDVPDAIYGFDPALRRVTLFSNINRSKGLWGTDIDYDSSGGFSGKLSRWNFRILAEKTLLAVVHSGKYGERSAWCAPRDGSRGFLSALPCVSWEKRRVWVVEGLPSGYAEYAYSKRILYIDQDLFGLVVTELYDQRGELWKGAVSCLYYTQKPYTGYPANPIQEGKYNYEDEWPFLPNGIMVDIRAVQATTFEAPSSSRTPSEWQKEWYFNEGGPLNAPEVHTLSSLKTLYYR